MIKQSLFIPNSKIRKFPEERYSVEEIFDIVNYILRWNRKAFCRRKPKINKFKLGADWISVHSKKIRKYKIFKESLKCAHCDARGKYFVKERSKESNKWHLSLYGALPNGKEVLMTCDHIFPLSRTGSSNKLTNLQTLCYRCNQRKKDKLTSKDAEILDKRRQYAGI